METHKVDWNNPSQSCEDQINALEIKDPLWDPKDVKYIKGTIIRKVDEDRVKQEDYSFYTAPDDEELNKILTQFHPNENDRFMFYNTEDQLRLIFGNDEKYSEKEETKYQEFIKHWVERDIKAYKYYDKSNLLRILDSFDFDIEATVEELNFDHKWRISTLPIFLSDSMKNMLKSGLYYVHGRDRSLRPITVFSPVVVLSLEFEVKEAILATHFVDQYIIDFMLAPGKVENWIGILDLGNLSFSSLPKKWILEFIKAFSHHYYARLRRTYLLNSGFGVRWMWNIVKIFVDKTSKRKIIVEGSNTHQSLQEEVHPLQLQNKFGGEAENITIFWPPYLPSNEYGIDPAKLNIDDIPFNDKLNSIKKKINISPELSDNKNNIKANFENPLKGINSKNEDRSLQYRLENREDFDFSDNINLRQSNKDQKEEQDRACCWSIF